MQLVERVDERVREWNVVVEETFETQSSFVAFGRRGPQPVVLKVIRQPGDEWRCGEVLDAFAGRGTVRVYEWVEGAVLLERLHPGTQLAGLALNGRDDEATEILGEVIQLMSHPGQSLASFATTEDLGKGFHHYLRSGDDQIPHALVEQVQHLYFDLCGSQHRVRLLHGDLHHYNVLDSERGWLAIDPKGVVGEVEYEIGAALRNPYERPELFASPTTVERRLRRYESILKVDAARVLGWGLAHAVLSAIWSIEDGFKVDAKDPSLMLAKTIQLMLT